MAIVFPSFSDETSLGSYQVDYDLIGGALRLDGHLDVNDDMISGGFSAGAVLKVTSFKGIYKTPKICSQNTCAYAVLEGFGWWVHYYFSNVQIQNTLVGFQPDFSLFAWAKGQARGILGALTQFNWLVLLTFIVAAIIAMQRAAIEFSARQSAMLLACTLTIGGKFLVFPLPDDRIYMAFILAMTLILLEVAQPRIGWRKTA